VVFAEEEGRYTHPREFFNDMFADLSEEEIDVRMQRGLGISDVLAAEVDATESEDENRF